MPLSGVTAKPFESGAALAAEANSAAAPIASGKINFFMTELLPVCHPTNPANCRMFPERECSRTIFCIAETGTTQPSAGSFQTCNEEEVPDENASSFNDCRGSCFCHRGICAITQGCAK